MNHLSLLIGFLLLQIGSSATLTCAKNPCLNGGTCKENANGEFERCDCTSHWDGKFCQLPNACKTSNPCENGGTCQTGVSSYYCKCPAGYNGVHCEYQPCRSNPCYNQGVCQVASSPNGFHCACKAGWAGKICEAQPCEPNPCKNNGVCTITTWADIYGFRCTCTDGWSGKTCEDKPCTPNPCKNGGTCSPSGWNGYRCACPNGWMGPSCTIENKCLQQSPCANGGTCSPDWHGNAMCLCPPTHMGAECKELLACPAACAANGGQCIHRQGFPGWRYRFHSSWACKCPAGKMGSLCEMENPCSTGRNPCLNGGYCFPIVRPQSITHQCYCSRMHRGQNCETHFAGVCSLYGDPHYITFDNQFFDNMDSCRQIILKTCSDNWPINIIPTFQIWVENMKPRMYGPSFFHRVGFSIYGYEVSISFSGGLQVTFPNGTKQMPNLPWPQESSLLADNFPLSITFDPMSPLRSIRVVYRGHDEPFDAPGNSMEIYVSDWSLDIYISHKLAKQLKSLGMLCGMCGNFDNVAGNDYSARSQEQYLMKPLTPDKCFAGTTMVLGGRRRRRRDVQEGVDVKPTCTTDAARKVAEAKCSLINDTKGPFADCLTNNPLHEEMFKACVFDVCYNESFLESNLVKYASVCSQYGKIKPWREQAGLGEFPCPKDMTYTHCGNHLCQPSCRNTKPCADESWKDRCNEGCECKEGTIWDHISNRCVEPSKCNKTDFGRPSGHQGPVPGPWNVPAEPETTTKKVEDEPETTTKKVESEPEATTKKVESEPEATTKKVESEPEATTEKDVENEPETTTHRNGGNEPETTTEKNLENEPEMVKKPQKVFQCCQKEQFNLTNQITCQFNNHCFLEGAELILGRCKKVCTCKSCGKMSCKTIKKPNGKGCKHYRKCLKCYTQGCFNNEEETDGDDIDCSPFNFYDALKKEKTQCCTDCAAKGGGKE